MHVLRSFHQVQELEFSPIQLQWLRDVILRSNNNKVRFDIIPVIYHLLSRRTHLISLLAGAESPWVYSMNG